MAQQQQRLLHPAPLLSSRGAGSYAEPSQMAYMAAPLSSRSYLAAGAGGSFLASSRAATYGSGGPGLVVPPPGTSSHASAMTYSVAPYAPPAYGMPAQSLSYTGPPHGAIYAGQALPTSSSVQAVLPKASFANPSAAIFPGAPTLATSSFAGTASQVAHASTTTVLEAAYSSSPTAARYAGAAVYAGSASAAPAVYHSATRAAFSPASPRRASSVAYPTTFPVKTAYTGISASPITTSQSYGTPVYATSRIVSNGVQQTSSYVAPGAATYTTAPSQAAYHVEEPLFAAPCIAPGSVAVEVQVVEIVECAPTPPPPEKEELEEVGLVAQEQVLGTPPQPMEETETVPLQPWGPPCDDRPSQEETETVPLQPWGPPCDDRPSQEELQGAQGQGGIVVEEQQWKVKLGAEMPNFFCSTTHGDINFHDYLDSDDSCPVTIMFSHPADFTPVCTTELGRCETLVPDFQARGVKLIGISCDPADTHLQWSADILHREGIQKPDGQYLSFPIIADPTKDIVSMLGMLDPAERDQAGEALPARALFVIGPDRTVRLSILYPASIGRNFDEVIRVIDALALTADGMLATPVDWKQGERCIVAPSVSTEEAQARYQNFHMEELPSGMEYLRTVDCPI